MSAYAYDILQAQRFLHMLDPTTDKFCFQFFKKVKNEEARDKPPIIGRIEDLESVFSQNQIGRFNATVILNKTSSASRKLADVQSIRVAYLDFDSKNVGKEVDYGNGNKRVVEQLDPEKLAESSFPPHMIVCSSPGNYHAYWALQELEVVETEASAIDYRNLQKAIAYTWSGDPGVTGLNQCSRIPGYWRFKDDDDAEPTLVSIIWQSDMGTRYVPGLLLEGLRAAWRKSNSKSKKTSTQSDPEEQQERDRNEGGTFITDEAKAAALSWLDKACEELSNLSEGSRDNMLNKHCTTAGGYVGSGCLDRKLAEDRLREAALACGMDLKTINEKLRRSISDGMKRPIIHQASVISPSKPHKVAERFIQERYTSAANEGGVRLLHYWRGYGWAYDQGRYQKLVEDGLYHAGANWLKTCKISVKKEGSDSYTVAPYHPKTKDYNELLKQVEVHCRLDPDIEANHWFDKGQEIPLAHCVPFIDGMLNAQTGEWLPPNPNFLNRFSCPLNHTDIMDRETPHWDKFLDSISIQHDGTRDEDMISLLQEWMGYLLTPDTSRHKMLIVVGPPRAGKGTIESVISEMLHPSAVGTFDAGTLSSEHGTEALVDKSVCIAPDYRNTGKVSLVTQVILGLVANDKINVNEKFQKNRSVRFATRVMLFSNDAPQFNDVSGAMSARTMFIQLQHSFVGKEDLQLKDKLKSEIEGITAWALQGLLRLIKNDRFTQPYSSSDLAEETRQADSPLFAFSRDRLIFGNEFACSKEDMYYEYSMWAEVNGYGHPKNKQAFTREIANVLSDPIANPGGFAILPEQAVVGSRSRYLRGVGIISDPRKDKYDTRNPPNTTDRRNERKENSNHF